MWQPSLKQNTNQNAISPNILKNFNPYDVLEPQKTTAMKEDSQNIGKLIDIEETTNKTDAPATASLNDTALNYDLIDLFQNIFVSPQHVLNETKKEITMDINYKEFFDKLEYGENNNNVNTELKEEFNNNTERKPKVLVPTIDLESDSDTEDPEAAIDELMTIKNIERRAHMRSLSTTSVHNTNKIPDKSDTTKQSPENTNYNDTAPLNDSTKSSQEYKHLIDNSKVFPTYVKPTHLDTQISNNFVDDTFQVKAMIKDDKVYKKKRIVKPDNQKINFTRGPDFYEKNIVLPQIMRRLMERNILLKEENCGQKRLILDSGSSESQASCSNCAKKEGKSAQQQSNAPKSHFDSSSVGASTTKSALSSHTKSEFGRKTGCEFAKSFRETSDLLKSFISNSSSDFDKMPSKSSLSRSDRVSTTLSNSVFNRIPAKPSLSDCKVFPKPTSLSSDKAAATSFKSGLRQDSHKPTSSNFGQVYGNPICSSSNQVTPGSSTIKSSFDTVRNNVSNGTNLGEFEPVVIMEDCNKERLIAWKRSQMIRNLVRTGKLHP